MSLESNANDLSVEEILKSVKQVINECDSTEILELTDQVVNGAVKQESITDQIEYCDSLKNIRSDFLKISQCIKEIKNILENFLFFLKLEKEKVVSNIQDDSLKHKSDELLKDKISIIVKELFEKEIHKLISKNIR